LKSSIYKTIPAVLVICLSTLVVNPAIADFEAGVEANRGGDRITALKEFQTAAKSGDDRAYGKLASMYLYGLGTEKNYQLAYVWFDMAYLIGELEAERYRTAASSMLSREDFSSAEQAAEAQRIELGLAQTPKENKLRLRGNES